VQVVVEKEQAAVEEQRIFDGVEVLRIEPIPSNLWKPDRQRYLHVHVVHLADGRKLAGCGDCPDPLGYVGNWDDVTQHRKDAHGYKGSGGGAPKGVILPLQAGPPADDGYPAGPYDEGSTGMPVEPADKPGDDMEVVAGQVVQSGLLSALGVTPQVDTMLASAAASEAAMSVPAALASMSFGEVLRLAAKLSKIGDLLEDMRIENATLKKNNRALAAEVDEVAHERDDALARLATASATIRQYHDGFTLMGLSFAKKGNAA
jgi:hypothetical protein